MKTILEYSDSFSGNTLVFIESHVIPPIGSHVYFPESSPAYLQLYQGSAKVEDVTYHYTDEGTLEISISICDYLAELWGKYQHDLKLLKYHRDSLIRQNKHRDTFKKMVKSWVKRTNMRITELKKEKKRKKSDSKQ